VSRCDEWREIGAENGPGDVVFFAAVIWFFDRDGEKLRYEISHDRINGRYRVVITHPDGTESVEEVDEPTELIERSVELMNSLRGEGWRVA
jgi:hypothetical protein